MERFVARQASNESAMSNNVTGLKVESIAMILKKIIYLYSDNWAWFLLAFALAFGGAYFFLKSTPPVYERTVSILIRNRQDSEEKWMSGLGIKPVNSNMTNEMEMLKTAKIAQEIVHRLNLNIEYIEPGTFHDNLLYGTDSPVKVAFLDIPEDKSASFVLDVAVDGALTIKGLGGKDKAENQIKGHLNDTITTTIGRIVVTSTSPEGAVPTKDLTVLHKSVYSSAAAVKANISPVLRVKNSTIIDINYRDVSKKRAEDVLNTLVGVYNENWIKDRNLKTVNTDKFIKERLSLIEDELGDVERSISAWKSQNLILDVKTEGSMAQSQVNEAEHSLQQLSNQEYMTRYIRDYLTDGQHDNQLLPANSGITNSNIESLIAQYNEVMLKRNNHLASTSVHNPLVKDLDENLAALRGSILQSLDYELVMLQSKGNQLRGQRGQAVSRIATAPQKSQQLLSVERQQKVKEHLYLYLLERREENELSQAFDVYNNQFIEPPFGSGAPVAPVPQKAYMLAFLIALVVPTVILGAKEFFNTRITGRNDLEGLSVPYGGDIPLFDDGSKKLLKTKDGHKVTPAVVVKEHSRNIINEAFRVIRTNLEFLLGFGNNHKIVMLTSLTPGSGKTFISANLSQAIAIRKKKVIVIDLDLRKGSLSRYVESPKVGVSNYLSGQEGDYHNLIVKLEKVDVLPCGSLPPNPAELLYSPRFKQMLEGLKQEYDFVILDCPPVEIVADSTVISMYADLTLFVVRVKKLYRDMLPDIEQWYADKKYGNLAIILNGVEKVRGKYGYHRYGYHYGSYGYGYGKSK
ncbi:MAG: polysaccharide biosynthesis tyrosine autokinase [Muribaculaceae bacterium]|nr:polysaccharide biosynthesis tyrosine autokinase [Muribaculaceae bacterium]